MGSFIPPSRAFRTAGLCTIALFAIAAWLPYDAIDFAAWLVAVFLGLPLSILTKFHAKRSAETTSRRPPTRLTFSLRLLGALSLLLGLGTFGWLAYNGFIRASPKSDGLVTIAQSVLSAALSGFGYRLLSRPLHAGVREVATAQPDVEAVG